MTRKTRKSLRTVIGGVGVFILISLLIPQSRYWIQEGTNSILTNALESEASVESLQKENSQLRAEVASLMNLKQENNRLRNALNIKEQAEIQEFISAQVISTTDSNYLRRSTQIDVGEAEGVKKGQAVIHNGFLIGTIQKVNQKKSTLQLITDPESQVAVTLNNETQSKGVLKSAYGVELTIDLVPQVESVTKDTKVFTSGIDTLPSGIPVGQIQTVKKSQTRYYSLFLNTPVDFQKIREVFVIVPS